jgi:hypothetical protein
MIQTGWTWDDRFHLILPVGTRQDNPEITWLDVRGERSLSGDCSPYVLYEDQETDENMYCCSAASAIKAGGPPVVIGLTAGISGYSVLARYGTNEFSKWDMQD